MFPKKSQKIPALFSYTITALNTHFSKSKTFLHNIYIIKGILPWVAISIHLSCIDVIDKLPVVCTRHTWGRNLKCKSALKNSMCIISQNVLNVPHGEQNCHSYRLLLCIFFSLICESLRSNENRLCNLKVGLLN